MHARHPLLSRWFSQALQGVPRSTAKSPSILQQLSNASRLRQPFSTTTTATPKRTLPHLQRRILPGRIHTTIKGNGSFQRTQNRFFFSSRAKNAQSGQTPPSLSQRLKTLSKEYGWSALGVYLLLSAMDFPICFLAVRWLGVERIGRYEHMIVESAKDALQRVWPRSGEGETSEEASPAQEQTSEVEQKKPKGEASMFSIPLLSSKPTCVSFYKKGAVY